jgi:hypothetical protein
MAMWDLTVFSHNVNRYSDHGVSDVDDFVLFSVFADLVA